MDLILTLTGLTLCAALAGWMILLERNPPPPGQPRLLPTTFFLFIGALGVVLALAHLLTILTGTPHTGRLG